MQLPQGDKKKAGGRGSSVNDAVGKSRMASVLQKEIYWEEVMQWPERRS
jgi:hypothetical protein